MEINPVKGTHDVVEEEALAYQEIEKIMRSVAEVYGFNEYRTPVLEYSELFSRSVGESSDIVRKEMYTFLDKANRSVTMRPEWTASIVRSIVSNKLYATKDLPIRAYYMGPSFRYERPQAGRYRQFNQFGVELIGEKNPYYDAEIIVLGYSILRFLGFQDITLKINTLGDDVSKSAYQKAIKTYFAKHIDKMCDDCKERLQINPLRILDCKVEEDQKIVRKAPKMSSYLNEESRDYFNKVTTLLDNMEIPFEIDETLVRGLDYYSDLVFEFHYLDKQKKSIGALGAGGHYDKLVSELGGGPLHGVGFAFGEERVYEILRQEKLIPDLQERSDIYVMSISKNELDYAYDIAMRLRFNGYRTICNYSDKTLKSQFKTATKHNAYFAVIVGEEEAKNETFNIKNLATQEQQSAKLKDLQTVVDKLFEEIEIEEREVAEAEE
ncbi:MAG: histidine--tRNA ligase [Bacilli bacterium]|jgi:histidyl-tRNA synthetase